jgi:periplasmic divalent cation tolerance protein
MAEVPNQGVQIAGINSCDARVVITTAGSENEARQIAQTLVEHRLAACVNIIPRIESIYRWQGKVENATEWLLIIKTEASLFSRIGDAIKEMHSYDIPECIMFQVSDGIESYLNWIRESVQS